MTSSHAREDLDYFVFQRRIKEMNEKPEYIADVLRTGARRCKSVVEKVMDEVREKIGVKSGWLGQ